jgi:tetratricopeptide (TPR) repeat protein
MGCRFEKFMLTGDNAVLKELTGLMGIRVHACIEYALDFAAAGLYDEADILLSLCITDDTTYPMVYYVLGYVASQSGKTEKAGEYYAEAAQMPPDRCFPNRIEEVNILRHAMRVNPADAKAPYYLGNFWYAARQYAEACECWERSAALDGAFPTVWRNLALACYNKRGEKKKAREMLEKAFALDPSDARILMELDQLYKKLARPHKERLAFLERHLPLVEQRDDLYLERITLYNHTGGYEKARGLIASRKFHPWEGGEGKATGQYILCRLQLAKQAIDEKRFADALALLHETDVYPHNLGEGKLPTIEENDVDYFKGVACRGLGNETDARRHFAKAVRGSSEPVQAFFYNDAQPEKIFYQGLAWRALGEEDKALDCFNNLIAHGEKHLNDRCRIDYFAVSLPDLAIWDDDLNRRNRIHCNYVMGLGYLGIGDTAKAEEYLGKVKEMDVNHQGAIFITTTNLSD